MERLIVAALFLTIASSPVRAQTPDAAGGRGQRTEAEQLLAAWTQECGAPVERTDKDRLGGWPAGQRFRVRFHTFFAQPVDDKLAGELEGNERRLLLGALLPLGLASDTVDARAADAGTPKGALVDIAGLGEALPPEGGLAGVYTGAAWRGLIALRDGGRCLAAIPFSARIRPPDALTTVAVGDPAAAPYLEALEAGFLAPVVGLVEALQGETGLSRLALSEADWRLRTGAVERLSDQALLAGIARASKAPWLRAAAVGKLTNQSRLDEIAQNDKDADVRKAALDRLAELGRKSTQKIE